MRHARVSGARAKVGRRAWPQRSDTGRKKAKKWKAEDEESREDELDSDESEPDADAAAPSASCHVVLFTDP